MPVFYHDKNVEFTRKKESNSMIISQIVSSQIKLKVVKSLLANSLFKYLIFDKYAQYNSLRRVGVYLS